MISKITDKRDIHFTDQRHNIAFHGEGHVLHDGRVVNDHSLPLSSIKTESNEQRNFFFSLIHSSKIFSIHVQVRKFLQLNS